MNGNLVKMVCHWYFSDDLNFIAGHLTLMDGNGHRYTVPIHTHFNFNALPVTINLKINVWEFEWVPRMRATLGLHIVCGFGNNLFAAFLLRLFTAFWHFTHFHAFINHVHTHTQSVFLMHSRHGMQCSRETHNLHTVDANNVSGEILSSLRNGKHKTKTKK